MALCRHLVSSLKFAIFRSRSGLEDGLDVDGHVAVRAAEAADDGEAETLIAANQLDRFGSSVENLKTKLSFDSGQSFKQILVSK